MLFNGFMKTNKVKRFNLTPRYHDPRKEALDDLVARVKAEDEGKLPTRHQLKFERKYGVHAANRRSNRRILIIIVALVAVIAVMFF